MSDGTTQLPMSNHMLEIPISAAASPEFGQISKSEKFSHHCCQSATKQKKQYAKKYTKK
jgi:hypothetical protein